ncbi:hybrid sensor histidine kinase/response regulator [Roseateles sp. BYS87W]|uniref:histidine kinase n=1 Tax=Pelomonas baiyunensis TaxID=3299026 RepID=A0ABW7H5G2_9BURK
MRRWPWLALPAALLLWAALALTGLQARLDRTAADLLTRISAPAAPEAATASAVVDLDDASLRALREPLGEWPYSREVYALMLDYLGRAGARLVVLDIVLAGPREGDARLAEALRRGPPVVLAAAGLRPQPGLELAPASEAESRALGRLGGADGPGVAWSALTAPADPLLDALTAPGSLGVISAPLDDDGRLRRVPLLHRVQGRTVPSLALAARLRADGAAAWRVEADDGVLTVGARRWPVDAQARAWLAWPADGGPGPRVSGQRLMRAALGMVDDPELAAQLAGRAVFVGSSAFFADAVMTPQGPLGGTVLNAAVFDALGATPAPVRRDTGGAVALAAVLTLLWGAWPLVWRRTAAAAAVSLAGLVLGAWAAWAMGWVVSPWPGVYVLGWALALTAMARVRQAQARERELHRERELAEARSRAKTDLLAQVSHEMRTPMNAVLGFSDILARSPLRPEQAHHVEVLGHAGRQVFALINDLLDNARIESGRLTLASHPFNLVDLVELQLELLRERAQSQGLWLRVFARTEATGWVLGDAQRVAQIVTNLVGNALKFTARGGVTVELARETGADGQPGQVCLSVQDTGMGIPADRLAHIFEPFEQADASIAQRFGGTGLGLAITRSLAQLMGGDIRVSSREGEGSRFEVRLDLPDARPPQDDRLAPRAESVAPQRSLNLLLAEDNDVNVLVIEGMLAPLGHRITRVVNGAQALQALRSGDFDLVLMDMLMPEVDGLTATRQWRAEESAQGRVRTPIVALTAHAFDADVQQSLQAGCDAHLTKPISLAALLQALARYARAG